jgi:DNA-binding MarR family transcriptional regulator
VEFSSRFKDAADASIGLVFIRAYNLWHTRIKRKLREIGITHPQFVVMTVIAYMRQKNEYISQAQAAAMADMDEMSVSQIVRALIKGGYMSRSDNPNDTRSYALFLSPKGSAAVNAALPLIEAIDEEFFGGLGEQRQVFLSLLHQLTGTV